jgi:hypothetical protein
MHPHRTAANNVVRDMEDRMECQLAKKDTFIFVLILSSVGLLSISKTLHDVGFNSQTNNFKLV